jgi:Tfp pilus assembly protein PilW
MIFGEKLSNEFKNITSPEIGVFNSASAGNNQLYPLTSSDSDAKNALRFVNCMRNVTGSALTLYGEKEVTDVIYVCTVGANDFNHTSNPTILSASSFTMLSDDPSVRSGFETSATSSAFTGSEGEPSSAIHGDSQNMTIQGPNGEYIVWPGSNVSTTNGNPSSFITGVTLWSNTGAPVVNATLSKPLMKSFDRELVIKVKLEF